MMKSVMKERLVLWVAVPALAAVLVALAVMQYKWSGQVSAATKAQMESSLQTSLYGFRQDVTRELGAVCLEVRSVTDESGGVNPAKMVQQFRHWEQTASHPGLVTHVYIQRSSGDELLRFDPNSDHIETVSWPSNFAQLRQRVQEISSLSSQPSAIARRQQRRRQAGGRPPRRTGDAFIPWLVDQSIPAAAYAVRRYNNADDVRPASITWIIIQFNSSVIEKEIFPELAQKYFTGRAGLDYYVAVLENGSGRQRVMYASHAGFGENNDLPMDASMNLFGPAFRRGGPAPPAPEMFAPSARPNERPQPSSDDRRDDRRNASSDRFVR
jgi:hypothetical protein